MTAGRTRAVPIVPGLVALAIACGVASTTHYRNVRDEARRLDALLVETGLAGRDPEVEISVRREPDPGWAAVLLARALLADELDRSWIAALPEAEREAEIERSPERLATAYEESARVLARRPANWQAAMTVGGAAYLLERRGLSRGVHVPWEPALRLAHTLGPDRLEPARILAAALVGHWSSLGEAQRAEALDVLRAAFRDGLTFDLLLGPWLRVAPGLETAFSVLPDSPHTWGELQRFFEKRRDWQRYAAARRRWYPAQRREIARRLTDGERRLRTGDIAGGREVLVRAAAAAPVEVGFADLFERAIRLAPSGWQGSRELARLSEWLSWSLGHYAWGRTPLPGDVLSRLVRELKPPAATAALAELAAGNLGAARTVSRTAAADPSDPRWVTFHIREALTLHDRGAAEEARALLRRLPAAFRGELLYRWAVSHVSEAAAPDLGLALGRRYWEEGEWERGERTSALRLLPERQAAGLAIRLAAVAPEGAVVELYLGGSRLALRPVSGEGVLRLVAPVEPVPQRLEMRTVAGRPVGPGSVTLLD